ncbi:MAG: hypothetical protein ACTHKJ_09375 [Candidatus Nitrosocosmicus sp.]
MHRQILHIDISFEITILVADRFIVSLINIHGKNPVLTDDGGVHGIFIKLASF